MKSAKKKATAKPSVRFKDLKSKRDPKGGASNAYIKFQSAGHEKWLT
jgi:hypothetical protein